jgi:hypothetical protein
MVFDLARDVQFHRYWHAAWEGQMETFMAGAAVAEIFLTSVILAVLMVVWAMRGMFWLMEGAGRPVAVRERVPTVRGAMVLARVRATQGQMSLQTRLR